MLNGLSVPDNTLGAYHRFSGVLVCQEEERRKNLGKNKKASIDLLSPSTVNAAACFPTAGIFFENPLFLHYLYSISQLPENLR